MSDFPTTEADRRRRNEKALQAQRGEVSARLVPLAGGPDRKLAQHLGDGL